MIFKELGQDDNDEIYDDDIFQKFNSQNMLFLLLIGQDNDDDGYDDDDADEDNLGD